jgi:hypothetical protein
LALLCLTYKKELAQYGGLQTALNYFPFISDMENILSKTMKPSDERAVRARVRASRQSDF